MIGSFAKKTFAAVAVLFTVSAVSAIAAGPVVAGFNATSYGGNDDGSYPTMSTSSGTPPGTPIAQPLGFSINFYGTTYSSTFINTNGNISFGTYSSTYTPTNLTTDTTIPIIAPFYADVDTRSGNPMSFGTGTVNQAKVGPGTYSAFGVNWPGVNYYTSSGTGDTNPDKTNNFQMLLISRADIAAGDFDIEFNYNQVQWETGDASGGTDGLGGTSAAVGYSAGTGVAGTFAQLTGSFVNGALIDGGPDALISNSNDGIPGQYLFEVRGGQVVTPPSAVPLPPAAWSSLALLGSLGLFKLIRSKKLA